MDNGIKNSYELNRADVCLSPCEYFIGFFFKAIPAFVFYEQLTSVEKGEPMLGESLNIFIHFATPLLFFTV